MSAKTSPESGEPSPGQTPGSTSASNGNGSSTPNDVEMKSLRPDPPKGSIPLGEDIMQLARMGEIGTMQKLFTAKKFTANHRDEEGITPLHWAAINNQYAMCRFLIDSGADVNAKGGESVATPAMWAAQRCHYYIVNLLLQNGADPLLTDVQGYNILHLATIDGNAFLLVLLLHQEIPVDVVDQQGHTGLMWAAYKGYPACVDLFLRWGANANAVDEGGLTPLHWALVKGSMPCVLKLLEYGTDRFAKTRDGKSPATVAQEMNTLRVWYRSLNERGFEPDGTQKVVPLGLSSFVRNKSIMTKFFFLWPFLIILVAIWMLSNLAIFVAVPLVLVTVFGMQYVAQQFANKGPMEYRVLQKTPYLAGVFAGTLFWVGFRYVFKVLPATYSSSPILNILFTVFFCLTSYFYIFSMVQDPGYVPKVSSRNQQRELVKELFDQWKFDEENFCIPFSLEAGIILFVQLTIAYINSLPAPTNATCNVINDTLCDYASRDPFTLILNVWITLQLVWVTMLCAVQLVQISRNQTTYENMRGHHIDRSYPSSQAFASAMTAGTTSMEAAGLSASGQGPNPALRGPPPHRRKTGCIKQWSSLLGIDAFWTTAKDGLRDGPQAARPRNPFSRGVVTNCRDFWCDPAPLFGKRQTGAAMLGGEVINYHDMYEPPMRIHTGNRSGDGPGYRSVASEDPERMV
ncbi:palmitoyltransferase akr1 [Penicillium rubens]|nr:palmitoyltransferase akr1 [Penicillium rubens]